MSTRVILFVAEDGGWSAAQPLSLWSVSEEFGQLWHNVPAVLPQWMESEGPGWESGVAALEVAVVFSEVLAVTV